MDYPTGAVNPPTGTFGDSEEIARLTRERDEARLSAEAALIAVRKERFLKEIASLHAHNATLRAALEPFAEVARRWVSNETKQQDAHAAIAHYEDVLTILSSTPAEALGVVRDIIWSATEYDAKAYAVLQVNRASLEQARRLFGEEQT